MSCTPLVMAIEGYASRFNEADAGGDIIKPGAFTQTLANKPPSAIKMLWQHDPAQPIGVWQRIYEDQSGLFAQGLLIGGVQKAADVMALVSCGSINSLSIGFKTGRARAHPQAAHREVLSVDLWEVSLVTFPLLATARFWPRPLPKNDF
ncbi:HK97 family phage prohead protease [Polycladidibacter stylochi]|uniref:HK97 family phage prohead protease n=1 Tax=Polycladidibacter stylochi TaxID=1807766 RepID=UPI000A3ED740|nr:HK97 family phage prohead protease [Pseudovibrio stylochi]